MTLRKLLLAGLVALIAIGAAVPSASAVEAPFWTVGGKRLETEETRTASIKSVAATEVVIHGKITKTPIQIRCKKVTFTEAGIEGSLNKHDGTALGTAEFLECKLFALEGMKFTEQPECGISNFKSKIKGRLWLEGTKANGGNRPVIVFEPKEGTTFAEVVITKKGTCGFAGTFKLEGSLAANISPEKEAAVVVKLIFPETPITTVWQPPEQEGEKTVELKFAGETASLQGELETELTSKESFGGFSPVQPFWKVKKEGVEKRLEVGEKKESSLKIKEKTETILHGKITTTPVEVVFKKIALKTGFIEGSTGEEHGKGSGTVELSESSLFAEEGGKFVAQKGCEVATPLKMGVKASLWYEGKEAEAKQNITVFFEPKEGAVFAEVSIKKIGAEKCGFVGTFKMEGNLAARIEPENKFVTKDTLVFPAAAIANIWQPGVGTKALELKFAGGQATLQGEMEISLVSGEEFDAFK